MAYINMKRIVALILSIMMIMAMTCTIAFASNNGQAGGTGQSNQTNTSQSATTGQQQNPPASGEDLFTKGENLLKNIQKKILGISSAAAAVFLVIAGCMWGFGNKQQSQAGWEWIKRILIAYLIINLASLIVATVGNLANI